MLLRKGSLSRSVRRSRVAAERAMTDTYVMERELTEESRDIRIWNIDKTETCHTSYWWMVVELVWVALHLSVANTKQPYIWP